MGWGSLLVLAVALSMDAFAVAVAAGITIQPLQRRHVIRMASHFGFFQAFMPILGWMAGSALVHYIASVDHWVAFGLLAFVGGRMILGGKSEQETTQDPTRGWKIYMLSIATSIDALAVGFSLAMISSPILLPALLIGLVTTILTAIGLVIGKQIGTFWGRRVEVLGGVILIAIGTKIVVNHLS